MQDTYRIMVKYPSGTEMPFAEEVLESDIDDRIEEAKRMNPDAIEIWEELE